VCHSTAEWKTKKVHRAPAVLRLREIIITVCARKQSRQTSRKEWLWRLTVCIHGGAAFGLALLGARQRVPWNA
jgi:hypothetical protein